jgi:hypothetical protein
VRREVLSRPQLFNLVGQSNARLRGCSQYFVSFARPHRFTRSVRLKGNSLVRRRSSNRVDFTDIYEVGCWTDLFIKLHISLCAILRARALLYFYRFGMIAGYLIPYGRPSITSGLGHWAEEAAAVWEALVTPRAFISGVIMRRASHQFRCVQRACGWPMGAPFREATSFCICIRDLVCTPVLQRDLLASGCWQNLQFNLIIHTHTHTHTHTTHAYHESLLEPVPYVKRNNGLKNMLSAATAPPAYPKPPITPPTNPLLSSLPILQLRRRCSSTSSAPEAQS